MKVQGSLEGVEYRFIPGEGVVEAEGVDVYQVVGRRRSPVFLPVALRLLHPHRFLYHLPPSGDPIVLPEKLAGSKEGHAVPGGYVVDPLPRQLPADPFIGEGKDDILVRHRPSVSGKKSTGVLVETLYVPRYIFHEMAQDSGS